MPAKSHVLSKSRFVSGVQCPKKLFFDLFRKDLRPEITPAQQRLFDSGKKVGEVAWQVFPGGQDASLKNFDFDRSIRLTDEWLQGGERTIYEAAFRAHDVLALLDIWHVKEGKRWAIEVKSSTGVKEYHYTDASLQFWVMEQAGYRPDHFFIMHINNQYVKDGDVDAHQLFTLTDITSDVIANQEWVEENITEMKQMIANGLEPQVEIGPHCSDPFECDYAGYCWQHIPENSVFELGNGRGREWELFEIGIIKLADIPDDEPLTARQRLQVDGAKHGTTHIDKRSITSFLNKWQYPLYFFDFETIMPSIPVLDGTRPFEQVPFQYSLHIIEEPGTDPVHKEFLASPADFTNILAIDPRLQLINRIKKDIGPTGSVVAYNAPFEKGVLKNLAHAFPEEDEYITDLMDRFADLLDVFKKGWYYLPAMGASASIKSVLPAIAPDFTYENLKVSDGSDASAVFQSMVEGRFNGDESAMRTALLEYCKMDTWGMVVVWKELTGVTE